MLYHGISDRSRGLRHKQSGDFGMGDGRLFRQPTLKKFDGAARSCAGWDRLRKDPELWFRNGNCFVHLYEKGHSRRGAAFKVPFGNLLDAQASPLIEKFVDRSVSEEEAYENGQVDLYIPAPPMATRSQALQYHLAARNFFAFIFRRSLVGDQLGNAIIGLIQSMEELRESDADNLNDLLAYLDEEGYLDMRNQPDHAVALLHVAEVFQFKDLYIDAFAHCAGMNERLYKCPELSRISVTSRKLIRRARVDMDFRLSRTGTMIGDLLKEELSEAHVGLSAGARAHLDRFRAYVHGFYLAKFGSFPPPPSDPRCGTIFGPEVYSVMKKDFEALYEYLVDEKFTTTDSAPSLAHGGLCAMQSVHEFDLRHKFAPLDHPLPLLPEQAKTKDSRRRSSMPWFMGGVRAREGKLRPDQRLVAHAALMRATNHFKIHLLRNELVLAYRKFEEDTTLLQRKGERAEKLGVTAGDARKVRWLFVYAMYQTLRSCSRIPKEVTLTAGVDYHLGVSTKGAPPWQVNSPLPVPSPGGPCSPQVPERSRSMGAVSLLTPATRSQGDLLVGGNIEIKPDIDYFALTHQEETPVVRGRRRGADGVSSPRSRSQSLTRSMSFRRSLSIFKPAAQRPTTSDSASPTRRALSPRKSTYHEIIVHGYGNGTNNVVTSTAEEDGTEDVEDVHGQISSPPRLSIITSASRSASTSSNDSRGSSAYTAAASSASTTPTTVADPASPTSSRQCSASWNTTINMIHDAAAATLTDSPHSYEGPYDSHTLPMRKKSSGKPIRHMYSNDDMFAAASVAAPPPLPRRSSKRFRPADSTSNNKRWSLADLVSSLRENQDEDGAASDGSAGDELSPLPLRIHKGMDQLFGAPGLEEEEEEEDEYRDSGDWVRIAHGSVDVSPPCAWEQFTDLGGLQPIHLLK